jgi:sulfite exporter TauE/SafE
MNLLTALFAATGAGLLGSPHCVGMCGPFAAAHPGAAGTAAWHAGRLTTYAALGAVAGAFGAVIPGPWWVTTSLSVALLVWSSAVLAGVVSPGHLAIPGVGRLGAITARRGDVVGRFLFGLVNGLLPCGLVTSALAMSVSMGSLAVGVAAMVAFGVGTVPLLAAVGAGAGRSLRVHPWVRRAVAAVVLISGLHAVVTRSTATAGHCHDAASSAADLAQGDAAAAAAAR